MTACRSAAPCSRPSDDRPRRRSPTNRRCAGEPPRTSGWCAPATRTRSSSSRWSSASPMAWAATKPARSPARSRRGSSATAWARAPATSASWWRRLSRPTRRSTKRHTPASITTGMGTTLTALVVLRADESNVARFALVNVGDSRTYLLRNGELHRATVDHSYVQELVNTGHISEDEARSASATQHRDAGARHRADSARRHLAGADGARRPFHPVQRRLGRRGARRRDRRDRDRRRDPARGRRPADRQGQRQRRSRQRHRGRRRRVARCRADRRAGRARVGAGLAGL